MIITPKYSCRNCRKIYDGMSQEIGNVPLEKLVPAARFTLGSQDHVLRIGGKTIQMSDLHQCDDREIGLANLLKITVDNNRTPTEHPQPNALHTNKGKKK